MTVFKRLPDSQVHVRTPIMIAVVLLLVVLVSGFCYYRAVAPTAPVSDERRPDARAVSTGRAAWR